MSERDDDIPVDAAEFSYPEPSLDELEQEAEALGKGALISRTSPERSTRQRKHLRALGHALNATVQVGHQGLHSSLARALDEALERHELVKVRALESAPYDTKVVALWIHRVLGADVVQLLGRTVLAYRGRGERPEIRLP